jgi:hypothetical protein
VVTYNSFVNQKPIDPTVIMHVARTLDELRTIRRDCRIEDRAWSAFEKAFIPGRSVAVVVENGMVVGTGESVFVSVVAVRIKDRLGGFGLSVLTGDPKRPFKAADDGLQPTTGTDIGK